MGFRLSRRTMLKSAFACVGLPFLEAMLPAKASAQGAAPRRLVTLFLPNGMPMAKWTPASTGMGFTLSPMLQPLAPFHLKREVTVVSNLANVPAGQSTGIDLGHEAETGTFMTCVPARSPGTSGISFDQVVANAFRGMTAVPSLQLGNSSAGYNNYPFLTHISWADATTPLPKLTNPRTVFDRLFPNPTMDQTAAAVALRRKTSVLDFVQADTQSLQQKLGVADRMRLDQYLTHVREVERQLQAPVPGVTCSPGTPPVSQQAPDGDNPKPSALRTPFTELMFDLIALAFACDATRVVSFQFSIGVDDLSYDFLGIPGTGHHTLSHETGATAQAQLEQIKLWEVQMLAYLCGKLDAIVDADGSTALHNSLVYASSEIGDGAEHDAHHLPVVIAGSAGGALKAGQHISMPNVHTNPYSSSAPFNTPRANLYLSMLQALGVNATSFGADGTATIPGLV